MRRDRRSDIRNRFGAMAASLAILAIAVTGCGTQDWQRDLLGLVNFPTLVPLIPIGGGDGPPGPAGTAGAPGTPGAPGPAIIIGRAVINADATLENSDDITAVRTAAGNYELTVDLTGDPILGGTTEDDFEVFVTLKERGGVLMNSFKPLYIPVSLAGTNLRFDVIIASPQGGVDNPFSVMVLLPAG